MPSSPGLRKAAILLMSLPEDNAAALMSKMDPKHVEAVSIEIAKMGSFSPEDQTSTIQEFNESNPNNLSGEKGGLEVARKLVEKALGRNASDTLTMVRQSIEALPFQFLQNVDTQNLLTFLIDEHPQTIALVLSHLRPSQAGAIIGGLPPERQVAVIKRVATMGQTSPDVIIEVEKGLEKRLSSVMNQSFEHAGGVKCVAEILNVTERATERAVLERMAQDSADLVEEIRRLMFVFDDINKCNDKDIQLILKNVDVSQWAMALKGSSDELKEKILGNMSQRAALLLKEEIEFLGAVRMSQVEQVQQQIVDVIRKLEDSGELILHSSEEDERLVQ